MALLSSDSQRALMTYADRSRRHRGTACKARRGGCHHCCETMSFVPKEEAQIVYRQVLAESMLEMGLDIEAAGHLYQKPVELLGIGLAASPQSDIQEFADFCRVELRGHAGQEAFAHFPTKLARHCWSHLVRRFL